MNPDLLLPLVASLGWLLVAGSAVASYRLGWGQMLKMSLIWIAIFGGCFLAVEWFLLARDTASSLV